MGSQQLVADELLAFIQYAIDSFDEPTIVHICKSSFKEEEVCRSKKLLFESLGKLDSMPSRRRDGGEKSVQDIITLLKATDPDDVPTFVAKQLDRIPPVSYEHIDCTRLLKDISFLKSSLSDVVDKLAVSESVISELRAEILSLRDEVSARSTPPDNVNPCRGAQNASVCSFESASLNVSPVTATPPAAPRPAARLSAPAETPTRASTSTSQRAYATAVARKSERPNEGKQISCDPVPSKRKEQRNDEGFIRVEKKKRKPVRQNKCGTAPTGPNHLLRPEIPTTQLYVSRVHYSITVKEVAEYVRLKTKMNVRVIKLESRHEVSFNSFVVRIPNDSIELFMSAEFWPRGVKFRRFRGRLPTSDTDRVTSPNKRTV